MPIFNIREPYEASIKAGVIGTNLLFMLIGLPDIIDGAQLQRKQTRPKNKKYKME